MPTDTYPLQDLLYRTTALTDDAGAIVEAYDTDAYGNTLIFDAAGTGGDWWPDNSQQTHKPACEFIFTGRRYDSETEIYFYRARYYNLVCGRFLSRDPLIYVDSMNLYQYVRSKPITFRDPAGSKLCSCGAWAPPPPPTQCRNPGDLGTIMVTSKLGRCAPASSSVFTFCCKLIAACLTKNQWRCNWTVLPFHVRYHWDIVSSRSFGCPP